MDEQVKEKILLTGLFLLILGIGFLAGRVSIKVDNVDTAPIRNIGEVSQMVPTIDFTSFDKGILYGKSNGEDVRIFVNDQIVQSGSGSFIVDTSSIKNVAVEGNEGKYVYVASKNSSVYHPVGSSTANRINAENKIYFTSKEEAEKAGFHPGSDVSPVQSP